MKHNLYHLIPQQIQDQLNFQCIEIQLTLTGTPAQARWPCAKILLDQQTLHDGKIIGTQQFSHKLTAEHNQSHVTLNILYHGKTPQDTMVNDLGEIVENQSLVIDHLQINGVDLIKTKLIYQGIGAYTMHLDSDKRDYFDQHGISCEPNHSLLMGENGVWSMQFEIPVLSFLAKKQQQVEQAEQQNTQELLEKLHEKLICLQKPKSII